MHAEAQVHLIVVSFQSSLLSTAIVVDKSSSVKKKKANWRESQLVKTPSVR